ncbi:MAG: DUF2304 domain-containing protein [Chloroflexi bacterium]|nr:DUF2304 domain-containing protein [Chloroflexota bacterium]
MMQPRAQVFLSLLGLAVLVTVINLVRTKKLREQYALLWLAIAALFAISPIVINSLDRIAYALGIDYPPALFFTIAFLLFVLILFQFSTTISDFGDRIKVLTQEIALLERRVRELENNLNEAEK